MLSGLFQKIDFAFTKTQSACKGSSVFDNKILHRSASVKPSFRVNIYISDYDYKIFNKKWWLKKSQKTEKICKFIYLKLGNCFFRSWVDLLLLTILGNLNSPYPSMLLCYSLIASSAVRPPFFLSYLDFFFVSLTSMIFFRYNRTDETKNS